MKKREITATGTINNNGGLAMYMGELNEFFKGWKGSRIIARFIVASPGSSEALKGYYFNYVVPTFKHAIWEAGERLTEEQTERRLREFSPIMYVERVNEETGVYSHDLRTVADLSNAELIEHIETLKQIAAEEYNTLRLTSEPIGTGEPVPEPTPEPERLAVPLNSKTRELLDETEF